MPLTTFVGTPEMTEVIKSELLPDFIDEYEYLARIWMAVAGVSGGKGNIPKRFGRWNQLTIPAGAIGIGETVSAPDATIDMTESTITPAMTRFRLPISDQVFVEAETGIPVGALQGGLEAMADLIDTNVLAVSTAATMSTGAVIDAFQLPELETTMQTYRALELPAPAGVALVLHDDALNPLETDIRVSQSPYTLTESDTLSMELGPAYQGRIRGFDVFRSARVAATGAGRSNFATPIGASGGLGVVVNELPRVVRTRGDDAENRASTFWHFRMWLGQGIRNPRRFLEVLSQ